MQHEKDKFLTLILFLPDYYRRLWHLTRSADLLITRSAGGLPDRFDRDTAGGDFHPALSTGNFVILSNGEYSIERRGELSRKGGHIKHIWCYR
jgi:hypothetical protein